MNKEFTKTYNENLRKIKIQLPLQKVQELYATYSPEDDGHLAKILTIRKVEV